MENEKRWKVFIRKYSFPFTVFFLIFIIMLFALNFLFNTLKNAYESYFVTGSLLKPSTMEFSARWIFDISNLLENIVFLVIIVLISTISGAFMTYKVKSSFGSLENNQKGSSRFTTLKEIQQQYKAVPEIAERYEGGGGVPISRYKDKIYIDDSAVNNLIIGTTRSGKGETYIFPTIDIYSRAEKQPSMIFNDPKGELYASSKETLEGLGYHVEVLNLMNPLQSMSYNLLELVKQEFLANNYSLAQQYARSIAFMLYDDPTVKDKYWSTSSIDLCTALILGLCEHCRNEPEKITMYNVALMMGELATETIIDENKKEISKLDEFFNRFESNHPARMQYQTIKFSGGQTRAGVLSNTNVKLGIFTLDSTAKLTSKNSLDMTKFGFGHWIRGNSKPLTRIEITFPNGKAETIKTDANGGFNLYHNHHMTVGDTFTVTVGKESTNFTISAWNQETGELEIQGLSHDATLTSVMQFEKPIALFMIVPDYDATFNVIASLYVKQLYTTLSNTATNVRAGKCFREVVFMLDEFGKMTAIDGMANILTVCLGRNIRFNLVIQAYSQIEKLYGNDWKTIDGNTNNTFYILSDDYSTAEMISKKIGVKTMVIKSRSGESLSLNKSKTENVDSRPLLNEDELMRLKEGEMIVIRTIKRQDKNRERIKQFAIFNREETAMKYRWEYLNEYYDTSKSINDIDIPCEHADLNLNELRVVFDVNTAKTSGPSKTDVNEVIDNISNGAPTSIERRPPKDKKKRMEDAAVKQSELVQEREKNNESEDKLPLTAADESTDTTTQQNTLNEELFRNAVKEGNFEEIFGDNFSNLTYAEIEKQLLLHSEQFKENIFGKLQTLVENGLKKMEKGD